MCLIPPTMLSLFNEDILQCLAEFLRSMDLFQTSKIGRKFLEWRFPTEIYLHNIQEIRQFERWCQMYDTSRLVKVNMYTVWFDNEEDVFGWVPPSVKTLNIYNNGGCELIIPDGVENLTISRCKLYNINIPNSVRNLTLTTHFNGSVRFNPNLQNLTVLNWGWEDPNQEQDYYFTVYRDLPDSINEIYIGSDIPLTFSQWPNNLTKLTIEKNNYIEYPIIPDWIEYTEINNSLIHIEEPDEEFEDEEHYNFELLQQSFNYRIW